MRASLLSVFCLLTSVSVFGGVALAADVVYDVTYDHDADWHFDSGVDQTECATSQTATSSHLFEPGPVGLAGDRPDSETGTPPEGQGSLEFRIGVNEDSIERFRNTRYAGKTISQIEELVYWTYTERVDVLASYEPAIWVRLAIDTNGDGTQDDTLVFEPTYQDGEDGPPQHEVQAARWQRWIADDLGTDGAEGVWWSQDVGPAQVKPLDHWVTTLGDATIVNPGGEGGVFVGAGCGDAWAGFSGNVDEFRIRFASEQDTTVFDMEPDVPGQARRLECSPETGTSPAGSSTTITCHATTQPATDSDPPRSVQNAWIDFELDGVNDVSSSINGVGYTPAHPDFGCRTDENGQCSISHGPATTRAGTTTYTAWIDEDNHNPTVEADADEGRDEARQDGSRPEPDNTDVVERQWTPSRLDCEPESVALQPGSAHTITCSVSDATGGGAADIQVDVEATGINDPDNANSLTSPDFTCNTGTDGRCVVTHGPGGRGVTTASGRTTYRAWIDHDKSNFTSTSADGTEGVNESSAPGSKREVDDTDVTEATWSTTAPSPTPGGSGCPTTSPSATPSSSASASPSGSPSSSASPSPSPCPSESASPTPTPSSPSPSPSETDEPPHGDPLMSGPCQGYFPDSRQPDADGDGQMIVGTQGDDLLEGTSGGDTICGLGGKDTLIGLDGDDLLAGNGANDILRGNAGQDVLRGAGGEDTLAGGSDDDRIIAGGGADILRGGGGNDVMKGGGDKDVLRGRSGNDKLFGGKANDALNGGPGKDLQNGGPGEDVCRAGGGRDRFRNCES